MGVLAAVVGLGTAGCPDDGLRNPYAATAPVKSGAPAREISTEEMRGKAMQVARLVRDKPYRVVTSTTGNGDTGKPYRFDREVKVGDTKVSILYEDGSRSREPDGEVGLFDILTVEVDSDTFHDRNLDGYPPRTEPTKPGDEATARRRAWDPDGDRAIISGVEGFPGSWSRWNEGQRRTVQDRYSGILDTVLGLFR